MKVNPQVSWCQKYLGLFSGISYERKRQRRLSLLRRRQIYDQHTEQVKGLEANIEALKEQNTEQAQQIQELEERVMFAEKDADKVPGLAQKNDALQELIDRLTQDNWETKEQLGYAQDLVEREQVYDTQMRAAQLFFDAQNLQGFYRDQLLEGVQTAIAALNSDAIQNAKVDRWTPLLKYRNKPGWHPALDSFQLDCLTPTHLTRLGYKDGKTFRVIGLPIFSSEIAEVYALGTSRFSKTIMGRGQHYHVYDQGLLKGFTDAKLNPEIVANNVLEASIEVLHPSGADKKDVERILNKGEVSITDLRDQSTLPATLAEAIHNFTMAGITTYLNAHQSLELQTHSPILQRVFKDNSYLVMNQKPA